jgi:hypothetical protein
LLQFLLPDFPSLLVSFIELDIILRHQFSDMNVAWARFACFTEASKTDERKDSRWSAGNKGKREFVFLPQIKYHLARSPC